MTLEQRGEQLLQPHRREPFRARLQLVRRPPAIFPDHTGLIGVETADVDDVRIHSDEKEAFEVALVDVLPAKDVVARPDRWRQRRGVDDQSDLLLELADDRCFIRLAWLDSSAGCEPPRLAAGKSCVKEQQPVGSIDDESANRVSDRWRSVRNG
jgi:hypothetical protein